MSDISFITQVFAGLLSTKREDGKIPVSLRPLSITGTVQDDPFDHWIEATLAATMSGVEFFNAGSLTTPDIAIRNTETHEVIGLEVKKVDQQANGNDSRGLTLDYNSCVPCGQMNVKIGGVLSAIRCYYVFALISHSQDHLVTLVIGDGDFLNYDFNLHIEGKIANTSQYGHGPYREGSVRGRAMYNYPNPVNTALGVFTGKYCLVIKEELSYLMQASALFLTDKVEREDLQGDIVNYYVYQDSPATAVTFHQDIFAACRHRVAKNRTAYTLVIP